MSFWPIMDIDQWIPLLKNGVFALTLSFFLYLANNNKLRRFVEEDL